MYPDPRRIVTGHDEEGNSIVLKDSQIPCEPVPGQANFAVLWETHRFPVSNDGNEDPIEKRTLSLANSDGVVLRTVDIAANTETVSSNQPGWLLLMGRRWLMGLEDVPPHDVIGLRNSLRGRA